MKRSTDKKLKFAELQADLGLTAWEAKGLLTQMWDVCYDNAPAGDIGRLSDRQIALAIGWTRTPPDVLVTALVNSRWLDRDDVFRLVVHDWSDHCENWLKGNFAKHGRLFADQVAKHRAKDGAKEGAKEGAKHDVMDPAKHGAKRPVERLLPVPDTWPGLAQPSLAQPVPGPLAVLEEIGIEDPALTAIVHCKTVTTGGLQEQWDQVRKDKTVRDPKRVFIDRVCKTHKIVLPRKGALSSEMEKINRDLLNRRRREAEARSANHA